MGCDIHMFIEEGIQYSDSPLSWWGFCNRINAGRNYAMFGILAGVRCPDYMMYPPRGLPDALGWDVRDYMYVYVDDEQAGPSGITWNKDGETSYCSLAKAEHWAKYGSGIIDLKVGSGTRKVIEHPDYHSHSWLTTEEYGQALARYEELSVADESGGWSGIAKYRAILRAMEELQVDRPHVRLVFCFDN
jgi:hypothetical protein